MTNYLQRGIYKPFAISLLPTFPSSCPSFNHGLSSANSTPRTCHSVAWEAVAFVFPCFPSEDVSGKERHRKIFTESQGIGLTLGGTVIGDPVKVKRGRESVLWGLSGLRDLESRKLLKPPSRMESTCLIQQKLMQLVNPKRKCKSY